MPRKVSFSTLREVTVNIEDTVEAEGEARPPPDACKPGGPTRASSSLVYLHMPLVLSRLVLENGVLDLAVSRIDPAAAAAAAAGGGGYYSYSEP